MPRSHLNRIRRDEQQQDNELTLSRNAVIAAETRAVLDLNHDFMLKQMPGSPSALNHLLASTKPAEMPAMPAAPPGAPGRAG